MALMRVPLDVLALLWTLQLPLLFVPNTKRKRLRYNDDHSCKFPLAVPKGYILHL